MPIPERIDDHCFEPQDDLRDECSYPGCARSELIHLWTVEAYRANPDFPSRDALIRLVHSLEAKLADAEALLREKDQQLHDEALAFNHANEVVGKLEADLAASQQECQRLREENERLKAPVSDEEFRKHFDFSAFCNRYIISRTTVDHILAARTQQAGSAAQDEQKEPQ